MSTHNLPSPPPPGHDAPRVAAVYRLEPPTEQYVARCPTCSAILGSITVEAVYLHLGGVPPVFARGPHSCPPSAE